LAKKKDPAATDLGRKGGRATYKKYGSDHYRKLSKKRKNRRGGRPPKSK
jgi:hypothetical protein